MSSQLQLPLPASPLPPLSPKRFVEQLLAWYAQRRRSLPWRVGRNAYRVWLSEVILQQTRVAQGLPYYERFVAAYPTVAELAAAPQQQVLRLWQGLGYYTRARKLHECAAYVARELGGIFPKRYAQLCKLPGVGPYTAAAIASIVHDEAVPVVDGNVYRVLARLFGLQDDISTSAGQQRFRTLAAALLPAQGAGRYNEALMEFGALQCTPKRPACGSCPFVRHCVAHHQGKVAALPVKGRRVRLRKRYFHYLVLQGGDGLYLRQRQGSDIWQGLYEFYLVESALGALPFEALQDELAVALHGYGVVPQQLQPRSPHQLTHQRIYTTFFSVQLPAALEASGQLQAYGLAPYRKAQWEALPKPVLVARYCSEALVDIP